jgi:predicted nucleic-acid-binding Zn-ribbon protein
MEYTKERAMGWLNNKWNTPKACPICKNNNWAVSESLALIPRLIQDGKDIPGSLVYPHFLVTCGTCGYTLFFNALVAGFLPQEKKEG